MGTWGPRSSEVDPPSAGTGASRGIDLASNPPKTGHFSGCDPTMRDLPAPLPRLRPGGRPPTVAHAGPGDHPGVPGGGRTTGCLPHPRCGGGLGALGSPRRRPHQGIDALNDGAGEDPDLVAQLGLANLKVPDWFRPFPGGPDPFGDGI